MRILFLTEDSDRPEAGLMQGVVARGAVVRILGNIDSPPLAELGAAGLPVERLVPKSRLSLQTTRRLQDTIRLFKPNIIHAFTNRMLSNAMLASGSASVKTVGYRGTAGNLSKWNPADWITYLNPRLDRIMCVSDAVKRSLALLGIAPHKLITIYKGHEISWYEKFQSAAGMRESLGIPPSAFVISCVANMRPVKGVDVLLAAAHCLPRDGSFHYLLVGELRDTRLRALAQDPALKSLVHFTGYQDDALSLVRQSDVFVMPSRDREGLPKSLLEAMAMTRPCVVTTVGGLPEVVREGIDGFLVPPEDPKALAQALERLWKNQPLRAICGANARERISTAFSLTHSVSKLSQLYEELLRE